MTGWKNKMLAALLVAVTVFSSAAQGAVMAAEAVEAASLAETVEIADEQEEEKEEEETQDDTEAVNEENSKTPEGSSEGETENAVQDGADTESDFSIEGMTVPYGNAAEEGSTEEDGKADEQVPESDASEASTEAAPVIGEIEEAPTGEAVVTEAPAEMPEFNAEKKAGRYVVKLHAKAGVLPKGTCVRVKEMSGADAKPYAEKAEKMAEAGMAMAVFDIAFTDFLGREIQPEGMVEVTFENAAEEDSAMSVFHAQEGDASKMERISASTEGDSVTFQNDAFSPYVLLAAVSEPNWTKGGSGTRKDVSDQIQFTQTDAVWYEYKDKGLGSWATVMYNMKLNGNTVGFSVCVDPRKEGSGVTKSETVYEVTAPMLVKALYYGFDGPGKKKIAEVTGTTDKATNHIVTHVAVSEIYARMGYTSKSSSGDGFKNTTSTLQELVKKYVKAIEDLEVPSGYYMYVSANSNSNLQDFGFGSYELIPHDATFKIQKVVSVSDSAFKARIEANSNYKFTGAVYGVFKEKDTAVNLRKKTPFKELTLNSKGLSPSCTVDPGTYYAVETKAPKGYVLSNTVYQVSLSSNEVKTLKVSETPKDVYLRIIKEPKSVPEGMEPPSLAGAVFSIYRDAKRTDLVGKVTTGEDGKTEQLREDLKGSPLTIQTYYVTEDRAPEGYSKVGNFSISTSDALDEPKQHTLIDREVKESLTKAGITVYKESDNPDITEGNPCYSLKGAQFGIYTDEKCEGTPVEVIETDSEGMAQTSVKLPIADYWVREMKEPDGFFLNSEIFKVDSESLAQNPSQEITVKETPKTDPAHITIVKRAANGIRARSLAGTEFTFCYYPEIYSSEEELPDAPERSWTIRTYEAEGQYIASFGDCLKTETFVEGDAFYLDNQGNPTFPIGTVTISETKAAEGYENDPDFGGGAAMMIGNVALNDEGKANFTVITGNDPVENTLTVEDTPIKPSIRTSAVDAASRSHMAYAGSETFRIVDTVSYENLNENTAYIMRGTLMDRGTKEPFTDESGEVITAEKSFVTGEEPSGTVDVEFVVDCSAQMLEGRTLVVREELVPDESNEDYEHIPGAEHWDPDDEEQTIYIPKVGTSLCDKDTGEKLVAADSDVELVDTVSYENLLPGLEYVLTGTLMDKSTGKPLEYSDNAVTASVSFTPDEPAGTKEISFAFNTAGLEGKSLVAYEVLTCGSRIAASHEDLDDEGQTVVVPGVETDACDRDTGKKNSLAAQDRVIVDEVSYSGLIAGKTYEVTGEVKIKPEGSEIAFDEAETVPSEIVDAQGEGDIVFDAGKVTFVPAGNEGEAVSGVLYVSFKVDASFLAGEEIVVGETVKHKGVEIAVHRDLSDHNQTVKIPDGQTVAIDTSTGIKNTLAADNRVFKDTFRYENLLPGETYRFTGRVMADAGANGEGGEAAEEIPSVMTDQEGTPVENGYVEFVPDGEEGSLDLYFSIDATELANRDVTVFEKVTLGGEPVIVHEVLDGTQTVYVPEGATTAVDSETGEQISFPDEDVRVIDTLTFRNLVPGKEYTARGRVMRKRTGDEVKSSLTEASFREGSTGKVTVSDNAVTFIPDQKDGAVELTFKFSGSELAGEDIVMFERVDHSGAEVIIHENIDDERQTIHFPEVHTTAADQKDGDHEIACKGTVTIVDEVRYENLLPGSKYRVSGVLMNKSSGKPVTAGGSEITGEAAFTAREKSGTVKVEFTLDSSKLGDGEYVVFETLYVISGKTSEESIVGSHRDLGDSSQTVKRSTPPSKTPRTGDQSRMVLWILAFAAAAAGIAGAIIYGRKGVRK